MRTIENCLIGLNGLKIPILWDKTHPVDIFSDNTLVIAYMYLEHSDTINIHNNTIFGRTIFYYVELLRVFNYTSRWCIIFFKKSTIYFALCIDYNNLI